MDNPLLSCIIPTYKKLSCLYDALDSVLEQDYPKVEIIVTDDGSDDFNINNVGKYITANNKGNIVSVEVLKHPINVGTVKNMNGAIEKAHGEIIIPLASDDQFADNRVFSKIAEIFEETCCEILVFSRMKYDENMQNIIGVIPSNASVSYINKHMNTPRNQYIHMSRGQAMDFASGASLCYRRDFFLKVGKFDEKYRLWEDGPFIAKITRSGYLIERRYDCIFVKYRDGGISSSKKSNKVNEIYLKDISSFYKREFVDHPEKLNFINRIIPRGLYAYYSRDKKTILKNAFFVIISLINMSYTKLLRNHLQK